MAQSTEDVDASGQAIPLGIAEQLEVIATYDPDCNLTKIINIWNLGASEYVYSEAIMDPQDGSVYLYGLAYAPMELNSYGILGKDVSASYTLLGQTIYPYGLIFDVVRSQFGAKYLGFQLHRLDGS